MASGEVETSKADAGFGDERVAQAIEKLALAVSLTDNDHAKTLALASIARLRALERQTNIIEPPLLECRAR
jgi:hypothetical protein